MCTNPRLTDEKVAGDILVDLEEASDSRTRATPTRPYAGSGPVSSFGGGRTCGVVENRARNWWPIALDRTGNARRMIVAIVSAVEVLGRSGGSRC